MYYIYALVDPRTNQPFYVGKGLKSNQRHLDHFNESLSTTSNRHKFFKIQALQRQGLDVLIQILQDNIMDENIAYQTETYYIQLYGRKNIDDDGVLTNICLDQKPPMHSESHAASCCVMVCRPHESRQEQSQWLTLTGWGPWSHRHKLITL